MAVRGHTRVARSFQGRRAPDRRRRRRILRLLVCGVVAGGLLTGLWYGTRAPAVTIQTVSVSGGVTVDTDQVKQEVGSLLSGRYLFLIPKRFSYFYPHDAIVHAIAQLPRVASVEVTRTSLATLSVALTEYFPTALWCPLATIADMPDDGCLFVSKEGFTFAPASSLRGTVLLRYRTEGRTPQIGTTFATAAYLQATERFAHALLERHGMFVTAITETKGDDVQYQLRGGGALLVARDADIQKVFDTLEAILSSQKFAHLKAGKFIYIDLRFGDKVFVKETEALAPVSGEATSSATGI